MWYGCQWELSNRVQIKEKTIIGHHTAIHDNNEKKT